MAKKEDPKEIEIIIDGQKFYADKRVFKSGRKGYGVYGTVKIDNYPHRISLNLIEL